MRGAYSNCANLITAVCGDRVTDMGVTYSFCTNLTTAVCGPNVTNMHGAYSNCTNLTTAAFGPNVVNMSYAYSNCTSLAEVNIPASITNLGYNTFYNCTNMKTYNFENHTTVPKIYQNTFGTMPTNCSIIVPIELYDSWTNTSNWSTYSNNIVPSINEKTIIDNNIKDNYIIDFNTLKNIIFEGFNFNDDTPIMTITSSEETVATISDIAITKVNRAKHTFAFKINPVGIKGNSNITINITSGDFIYTKTFAIEVVEEAPVSYTVEAVNGASYGFELNSNGYYESKNKGKDDSYALCKVVITNPCGKNVYFDCINYAESNYDFGILSEINTTLKLSSSVDTSNVKYSFKGKSQSGVQTVAYDGVEGFVYVKFRKDSSSSNNNDTLQFKVRFA